jgi:DNA-binding beta-propeller fold protein YncE
LFALLLAAWTAKSPARPRGGSPVALVTAESENELLAIALPGGRVLRRIRLPADPENIAVSPAGPAVVVSAAAGAVTLLAPRTLRIERVFRGFRSPHIAALSPDGERVYVTDDGAGTLTTIPLAPRRSVSRIHIGSGAHHVAVSPDGSRLWIALGERARTIVVVDAGRTSRPRVVERFDPGFPAHDLAFDPSGRRVWVTSDSGRDVVVLAAATHRRAFSVPVGPPPQHVAFGARGSVYLTSGYGSLIERVQARNGRVLRTARVPYGSFNVATAGGLVVVSSLLRGTVTELDDRLEPLLMMRVAPAARDAGIAVW